MRHPWNRVAVCLFFILGCTGEKSAPTAAQAPAPQANEALATPPSAALEPAKLAKPSMAKGSPGSPFASTFGGDDEAEGGNGLGLGGTGEGTIGLGNDNTVGEGGGGGSGPGIGRGEAKKEEPVKAPVETWHRAKASANVSRMMIGDTESLPLDEMNVSVRVDGYRARVILDLYYPNNTGRTAEGNFSLKLPEDATPFFFAFGEMNYQAPTGAPHAPTITQEEAQVMGFLPDEIVESRASKWTNPKIARMVPKEQAAYAYRETVRAQTDPALAEWAGAGVFNARVFPLAPNKTHRVVVGYDVDLVHAGDDLELKVELPEGVETMTVDLSVARLPGVSIATTPALTGFLGKDRTYYRLTQPKRELIVRQAKAGTQLLVGNDPQTGDYFASRVTPELESDDTSNASQAIFLVDVSLSANPDQFNIWLKLLQAILEENRPQLARFSVIFFNVEGFSWRPGFVDNTKANVDSLLTYANGLSLEGATDIGAVVAQAAKLQGASGAPVDIFLLSDGASTWGETEAFAISSALQKREGSFYAYTTGMAGADLDFLRHITREGRGAVFSVVGESQLKEVATAHRKAPWTLVDASVEGGSDLLISGRPQAIFPGQDLLLVGRGTPKSSAKATLKLKQGKEEKTVEVDLGASVTSDLAPRLYGQVATNQLEDLGAEVEDDAKAYARHFRITGRTTSLLMLDNEYEYTRFGIKPEDDAARIKKTTVADKVSELLTSVAASLSDPKKAFLIWEKRLSRPHGSVEMSLPSETQTAIEALPSSAFAVSVPPLTCKLHFKAAINKDLSAMLEKHELDYDAFTKDAAMRGTFSACDALKTLSSLIEENPGDTVLARDVAYQAVEMKLPGQAYGLFKRVLMQRSYEPQTYHAIALVLASLGKNDLAMTYFELGLAGDWDSRFGEFKDIISLDYLRFLHTSSNKLSPAFATIAKTRVTELTEALKLAKADLVVTITWNTDGTDMDLHVTEPSGEECFYGFRDTYLGGSLTQDVTQGYGPEMYVMKEATQGQYKIQVHSYATDRNRMSARTKILATVYQKFGSPQESVTRKVITLDDDAASDDEDKLQDIMIVQLAGKPLVEKPLTEDDLTAQADSARSAIYSILAANGIEPSDKVQEKLDRTTDAEFLKRWMSRAIYIKARNTDSEFALLLSERTLDDIEDDANNLRTAIADILEANGVILNTDASAKLDETSDNNKLRAWMIGALTAKYGDTLILSTPGKADDAPDSESGKDVAALRTAIEAILMLNQLTNEEGEFPELGGALDNAVDANDDKTLRAWMLKAPYVTNKEQAKKLFIYAAKPEQPEPALPQKPADSPNPFDR